MEDLDSQVATLKKRITEAQSRRAQAQGQAAAAQERLERSEKALRDEFGIGPEAIGARIASLEDDLAAEVRRVTEALERAEASE